ncbi:MAG: type II toxin-antitoxin system RelE/ParE family toxin [bacterium]
MGKIVWSPVARADLDAIADYIAKDSPARAAVFVDRLLRSAEQLADFPEAGRAVPEIGDPASREVIVGPYRIMYHLETEAVVIVAIVHGARRWPPT